MILGVCKVFTVCIVIQLQFFKAKFFQFLSSMVQTFKNKLENIISMGETETSMVMHCKSSSLQ